MIRAIQQAVCTVPVAVLETNAQSMATALGMLDTYIAAGVQTSLGSHLIVLSSVEMVRNFSLRKSILFQKRCG